MFTRAESPLEDDPQCQDDPQGQGDPQWQDDPQCQGKSVENQNTDISS